MFRFLAIIGLSLATFSVMPASAENIAIVGTGVETGVYYPVGGAICRLVTRDMRDHGLRCLIESTGGSISNLVGLHDGSLQFGLVQSDLQYSAYKGTGVFAEAEPFTSLRSLFSLYSEAFTVVARDDSGIRSFDQLRGKRVNIGSPGSGARATMDELMHIKGWTNDSFRAATEFRASEQAKMLCEGKIDAFVFATGHPNGSIQQVAEMCPSHIVPLDAKTVDALTADKPYFTKVVIPGGMYKGTSSDVPTFGVKATVVSTSSIPDETVYQFVKAVFSHLNEFRQTHPILSTLDSSRMIDRGLIAPLHEGAARYYREAGLLRQ